jgi:hypothetical protein
MRPQESEPSHSSAPGKPTERRLLKASPDTSQQAKRTSKAHNGHITPRQRDTSRLDDFGLRIGSVKSTAANMYARHAGATLAEVKGTVGSIQFNVLRELESKGFALERKIEDGKGGRKATRYFLHTK